MKNSSKYLLVSIVTFLVGYAFLRQAYIDTADLPFAQEIVLLVLGTIATIAITAALLNKQSEVELEKEQRVKIFDLKSETYFGLIDFIEQVIIQGEINPKDLIKLEFLTHKISTIANPAVLEEYSNFIQVVKDSSKDEKISAFESDELSLSLARLCGTIRYDLIANDSNCSLDIQQLIESNIDKI